MAFLPRLTRRQVLEAAVVAVSVSALVTMVRQMEASAILAAVFLAFKVVVPTAATLNTTTIRTEALEAQLGRAPSVGAAVHTTDSALGAVQHTVVSERAHMGATTLRAKAMAGSRRRRATRGSAAPALAMAVSVALLAAMELMAAIETGDQQEDM